MDMLVLGLPLAPSGRRWAVVQEGPAALPTASP
jgi:hypothetical protein